MIRFSASRQVCIAYLKMVILTPKCQQELLLETRTYSSWRMSFFIKYGSTHVQEFVPKLLNFLANDVFSVRPYFIECYPSY
jgi:hypothetical protein